MKPKKRIALIIPSLNVGGMERVMSELANYFSKKKELEIHLLLYGKSRSIFYQLSENIIIHIPTFIFNDNKRLISTVKTISFLRKTIKIIKPDATLSFGEYWNSLVLLALKYTNYSVYISDRCQPNKQFNPLHDFLRKWLYPDSAGIIAQTEYAKTIYQKVFKHPNIEVIFNPVRKIPLTASKKEKQILTVGRLITTKHHDRLIKIFANLNAPNWRLVIVGGNALKQKNLQLLKQLSRDLNIQTQVLFTGEMSAVENIYNKSMLFAFTSSSEGFPNVIGEAMSAGIPVVTYDCIAGPSEIISDGKNGYLIPLFDDGQFQIKLQKLIDDDNLRRSMGKNAKESISILSIENIGEQYLNFILS